MKQFHFIIKGGYQSIGINGRGHDSHIRRELISCNEPAYTDAKQMCQTLLKATKIRKQEFHDQEDNVGGHVGLHSKKRFAEIQVVPEGQLNRYHSHAKDQRHGGDHRERW
jgi:hypothetical protein